MERSIPRVPPRNVKDGDIFADAKGHRWRAKRITSFVQSSPSLDDLPRSEAAPKELSDEEYAEAMRPVRLEVYGPDDAIEYTSVDPVNVEPYRVARRKQREGRRMRQVAVGRYEEFSRDEPISAREHIDTAVISNPVQAFVLGAEDRTWVPFNGLAAGNPEAPLRRPQVQLERTPTNDCSGTMIGLFTAISAAHCFHTGSGGGWLPPVTWRLGRLKYTDTWTFPGAVDTNLVSGTCYAVTVPTYWITNGNMWVGSVVNHVDDFSLMEFTCTTPGSFAGSLPTAIGSSLDYATAANSRMIGYDQGSPLPAYTGGRYWYGAKSLLTRSGTAGAYALDTGTLCGPSVGTGTQLAHSFDATNASSGAGLLGQLFSSVGDPTWYYVAEHWGFQPGSTYYKCGRVLTWGTWGWIQNYSNEF